MEQTQAEMEQTHAEGDVVEVLHKLQVHRAELEMQNRELRESREALEASHARYADLFDFAPVGYMTLDRTGSVLEINLTAASLLKTERQRIVGKPFRVLVRLDPPDALSLHIRESLSSRDATKTELTFVRP